MHSASPSRWMVILAFGLVYLFWGSTYLAIDIAVQTIPPALMCGVRFSIAGVGHARGLRRNRAQDSVFSAANRVVRRGRPAAADGRQPDAFLRGTRRLVRPGRADRCHHTAVVSGARFPTARRPSHFRTRQSRSAAGDRGIVRPGVAAVAVGHAGAPRAVGFDQPDLRLVQLGAGLGALEALAVGHGRLQRHRLASHGGGSRELSFCDAPRRSLARTAGPPVASAP